MAIILITLSKCTYIFAFGYDIWLFLSKLQSRFRVQRGCMGDICLFFFGSSKANIRREKKSQNSTICKYKYKRISENRFGSILYTIILCICSSIYWHCFCSGQLSNQCFIYHSSLYIYVFTQIICTICYWVCVVEIM